MYVQRLLTSIKSKGRKRISAKKKQYFNLGQGNVRPAIEFQKTQFAVDLYFNFNREIIIRDHLETDIDAQKASLIRSVTI